jgi:hypothetical protein
MLKPIKNKNVLFILAIVTVCVSLVCFLILLYINSINLEKQDLYVSLSVGDVAGMDLNSTALTFGELVRGSNYRRNISIENNYDFPVVYNFKVEGNISNFLIFDKKIHLFPGENKSVPISTITITNETYGYYDGFLKVVVKKDI